MTKLFLTIALLIGSLNATAGVMSDIHLQTHDSIHWHFHELGHMVEGINDMNFSDTNDGCKFNVSANVMTSNADYQRENFTCSVCFKQEGPRNYVATSMECKDLQ